MKFSLILATLGRDRELAGFLESLANQTCQDFELIVIDQNRDGRIDPILEEFGKRMCIRHVKVDFTGTAPARDYGIRFVRGDVVAFPDDDCLYETDVLERVLDRFRKDRELGVLVAGSYDFSRDRFSIGVNSTRPTFFTQFNMMGVEFTHFFRLARINRADFYMDHDFGIGSKYAGGEGFEMLYRLLRAGAKAFYTPQIRIYHADKDAYTLGGDRIFQYSAAVGAFIRKFCNQRDPSMGYYILRKMVVAPLAKILWSTLSSNGKKRNYYCNSLLGIWQGFLTYRK